MLFSLLKHYLDTATALKVSQSVYCFTTSVSHGVENYFPRLWGMGISDAIFYWLFLTGRRFNLFIGDTYNSYTCPLQPCRHLTLKLLFQDHPRSAKVPHIADFKSAYISLIIGPRGLQCETNL